MSIFNFWKNKQISEEEKFKEEIRKSDEVLDLCKKVDGLTFERKYKGLEIYLQVNDFENIRDMNRMIELLEETVRTDVDYAEEKAKLEHIQLRKEDLDMAAHNLEKIRLSLTEEILNFSNIVKEVSSRYKLSPTWEGKKPILIEKQKELERRKSEYEKNEKQLDACFIEFYKEYTTFHKEFCGLCTRMIRSKK